MCENKERGDLWAFWNLYSLIHSITHTHTQLKTFSLDEEPLSPDASAESQRDDLSVAGILQLTALVLSATIPLASKLIVIVSLLMGSM